jgi:1-phosphatidylinositol phosphodiesterase
MLNAGIRVFDLRYAWDVTNTTLVFWHTYALASETATVDDVMYGFYQWLDDHPTEAIFLSFQYESGVAEYSTDDAGVQLQLYNTLTSPAARHYIHQSNNLGALGEARGKITLLRRFDLNLLPASYTTSLPGLHFSPSDWTDNSPNITLVYNSKTNATAYIEDYYQPLTPQGSNASENIRWKLNATEAHLTWAASDAHPDDLFWTFASSTNVFNIPPDSPQIQALGNGTLTPEGGVNNQLISFLKGMVGKRLGIVMFDFYEQPSELLPLFLSLLPPPSGNDS